MKDKETDLGDSTLIWLEDKDRIGFGSTATGATWLLMNRTTVRNLLGWLQDNGFRAWGRTQEELAKRLQQDSGLVFGYDLETLIPYADFAIAKKYLSKETLRNIKYEEAWNKIKRDPRDREAIIKDMSEYMHEFGWPKAMNHRGLSAARTLERMGAWLWLLEDEETMAEVERAGYENYGCPKLAVICRKYKLPIPDDEGVQNMIEGRSCGADYECGCGK